MVILRYYVSVKGIVQKSWAKTAKSALNMKIKFREKLFANRRVEEVFD